MAGYPAAPRDFHDPDTHRRQLAESINNVQKGKLNNTGEVTLTANAATSTLTDPRLTVFSVVTFDPMTANAATELYGATMYCLTANRNNGTWTITHANNAQTDRQFRYTILGGEGMNYT